MVKCRHRAKLDLAALQLAVDNRVTTARLAGPLFEQEATEKTETCKITEPMEDLGREVWYLVFGISVFLPLPLPDRTSVVQRMRRSLRFLLFKKIRHVVDPLIRCFT